VQPRPAAVSRLTHKRAADAAHLLVTIGSSITRTAEHDPNVRIPRAPRLPRWVRCTVDGKSTGASDCVRSPDLCPKVVSISDDSGPCVFKSRWSEPMRFSCRQVPALVRVARSLQTLRPGTCSPVVSFCAIRGEGQRVLSGKRNSRCQRPWADQFNGEKRSVGFPSTLARSWCVDSSGDEHQVEAEPSNAQITSPASCRPPRRREIRRGTQPATCECRTERCAEDSG